MSQDRGMKKWAPYKSLNEQEEYLKKIHDKNNKPVRPIISNEVAEEINSILVNYSGEELLIKYWRNERINEVISVIKKIDIDNKKIVLPERKTIYLSELIGLEKTK